MKMFPAARDDSVKTAAVTNSYLTEAPFGNVDVTVAHLHVDPQTFHNRKTVLIVPQVLQANSSETRLNVCV